MAAVRAYHEAHVYAVHEPTIRQTRCILQLDHQIVGIVSNEIHVRQMTGLLSGTVHCTLVHLSARYARATQIDRDRAVTIR